jgi:hypothetical protein
MINNEIKLPVSVYFKLTEEFRLLRYDHIDLYHQFTIETYGVKFLKSLYVKSKFDGVLENHEDLWKVVDKQKATMFLLGISKL